MDESLKRLDRQVPCLDARRPHKGGLGVSASTQARSYKTQSRWPHVSLRAPFSGHVRHVAEHNTAAPCTCPGFSHTGWLRTRAQREAM